MCRLCHVATDRDLLKVIGKRLKKLTLEVTLNAILADDTAMIGFETAALLPLWCQVHVKASVGLWELPKGYLLQLAFALLRISVYDKSQVGYKVLDLKGFTGNPVAMHFNDIKTLNTADIPHSVKELYITNCSSCQRKCPIYLDFTGLPPLMTLLVFGTLHTILVTQFVSLHFGASNTIPVDTTPIFLGLCSKRLLLTASLMANAVTC